MENITQEQIKKNRKILMWYLIAVIILFFALISVYFMYIEQQKEVVRLNEENKNNVILLSQNKIKSAKKIDSLLNVIVTEANRNDSLIEQLKLNDWKDVDKILVRSPSTEKNQIEAIKNTKYLITLHSFNVNESSNAKIMDALRNQGFEVKGDTAPYTSKPSWMSDTPSVLYYSKKSKKKAEKMAKIISSITRKRFSVKMGAGYGVIEGLEEYTFFIHNVGN